MLKHVSRPLKYSLALTLFAGLAAVSARAQGLGTIVGTVTDASGAVVPNASITAINGETQFSRDVQSNGQGYYVLAALPPATYDLKVVASGFASYLRKQVTVLADQNLTVDVGMTVKQQAAQITIEATPTQVDTSTATLSQVVEQKRIVDLPLNGRNAASLALLVPGTTQAPPDNADQGQYKTFPVAVTVSANGSRANQTSFNMDGMSNNDVYTNVNQPFPFPDALQEFSVQTSDYSSRYGGNSGASVNIITKSGTNELHGDAFEFVRNAVFNARNSFAATRDQLKRNQFGFTLGGPVVLPRLYNGHNRTFFFLGYQGTQIRNVQNGISASVPTAAELNGDFSALLNPSSPANPFGRKVQIVNPVTNLPYGGNLIPVSSFDPAAVAFTKYLPIASAAANGRVFYSEPLSQGFNEYLTRVDHSFSERDRLSVRYYYDRYNNNPFLDPTNYLSAVSSSVIDSHNGLVTETHTFAPNLLNEFRIGISRVDTHAGPPPGSINVDDLGLNLYQPSNGKSLDGINVSGYFNLNNDFPTSLFVRNNYSLADDVSWVVGRHTIAFGGTAGIGQVILRDGYLASGQFGFSANITNNAAASFLLGNLTSFSQGAGEYKDNRDKSVGLYVQDDYHVTSRLTLNLGLRWEPFFPWNEIRGRVEQFRISNYQQGIRSQEFPNAPPGLLFPGDPGMPQYGVNGAYLNLAPRVGFAYDVTGNGKTSVRGGFGIFQDAQQIGIENNRFVDVSPFSTQISLTQPPGPFSNPYLGYSSPFPAPYPPPKNATFPAPVLVVTYDPANNSVMKVPVTYNYNFTVEHQFAGWLAHAAYVGSLSRHQTETIELNPAAYIAGSKLSTDTRRIFPGFGSIGQSSQDLNSNYNSLQLTVQRRFARGLTVLANYTYSKSLDDVPNGQGNAGISSQSDSPIPWYEPGRHQFDYGPSDFNHEHNLVVSFVYDTPRLLQSHALVRGVFGDWEATGILSATSGFPLTILAGQDTAQTGITTERAVVLSSQVNGPGACKGAAPCQDYLNVSAFALPSLGTYGNVGKGAFTGPGFLNLDFGLLKNIPLHGERYRLQLRGEFFNATNRVNLSNPNVTVTAAGFGTITGARDPRIGQMALKLMF